MRDYYIRNYLLMGKLNLRVGWTNPFRGRLSYVAGNIKNDQYVSKVHRLDSGARSTAGTPGSLFSREVLFKQSLHVYAPGNEQLDGLDLDLYDVVNYGNQSKNVHYLDHDECSEQRRFGYQSFTFMKLNKRIQSFYTQSNFGLFQIKVTNNTAQDEEGHNLEALKYTIYEGGFF